MTDTRADRDGFVHIPGVLSEAEVEECRNILEKRFKQIDPRCSGPIKKYHRDLHAWWAIQQPKLRNIMFKPHLISELRILCGGDLNYVPTFSSSRNAMGLDKIKVHGLTIPTGTGWHVDSAIDGKANYLTQYDYRMFKCGFFLQDNSEDYGGGIDVAPGCHAFPIKSDSMNVMFRAKNIRDIIGYSLFKRVMPFKAGDFIAFDYRLPHRSTLPKKLLCYETPADRASGAFQALSYHKTKYTLYFDCGNRGSVQLFLDSIESYIEANLKSRIASGYVSLAAAGFLIKRDKAFMKTLKDRRINLMTVNEDLERQCVLLVEEKNMEVVQ